ncbi:MAG: clostripain-related cysteine peptidase [Candidatus Eremiobacteraeota bacterium]|nr:clostripain-related cysteine peptidase [Candidatus Eremiobacteraeota bacterium]
MISPLHSNNQPHIPQREAPRKESAPEAPSPGDRYVPSQGEAPGSPPAPEEKEWTVLYYFAGNNAISDDMIKKISRLEAVGSDGNVNVAAQLGRASNSEVLPGGNRFFIEKHTDKIPEQEEPRMPWKASSTQLLKNMLHSKPVESLGPTDMSNPDTLADFVAWGMKKYPSKHTLVVVMDHGYGFLGSPDDNEVKHTMTINEMSLAMRKAQDLTGKKVDIIGFDTCLMAQAEVAYQLRDAAGYLVATEEIEYPLGWPEAKIVKHMKDDAQAGPLSAEECAQIIVEESSHATDSTKTMSALKLEGADRIAASTNDLADALLKLMAARPEMKILVRDLVMKTHNYCLVIPNEQLCQDYRDLYSLAENLASSGGIASPEVKKAAESVMNEIKQAVVAEMHAGEEGGGSHGVSIYIPTKGFIDSYKTETGAEVNPHERYLASDFARATLWDELIEKLKA